MKHVDFVNIYYISMQLHFYNTMQIIFNLLFLPKAYCHDCRSCRSLFVLKSVVVENFHSKLASYTPPDIWLITIFHSGNKDPLDLWLVT